MSIFRRKRPYHSELVDNTLERGSSFSLIRLLVFLAVAGFCYVLISTALFQEFYWFENDKFVRLFPEMPPLSSKSSDYLVQIGFYFRCLFSLFSSIAIFTYFYFWQGWLDLIQNVILSAVCAVIISAIASYFITAS